MRDPHSTPRTRAHTPTRRAFLRNAALGGAAFALTHALPSLAHAQDQVALGPHSALRHTELHATGRTLWFSLQHAPFPCSGAPYRDSTVIVHVPHGFAPNDDGSIDAVVHFHGINDRADHTLARHLLREQLHASHRNALLILPQGPWLAKDVSGGKLDQPGGLKRLLREITEVLGHGDLHRTLGARPVPMRDTPSLGKLVLSAHSGGFQTLTNALRHGGVEVHGVFLFDAMYGFPNIFANWLAETRHAPVHARHRFVSLYNPDSDLTSRWTQHLIDSLRYMRLPYRQLPFEPHLQPDALHEHPVVFFTRRAPHDHMPVAHSAFRYSLQTTALGPIGPAQRRNAPVVVGAR